MKWDHELKVSGARTELRLMVKCCRRKTTKKSPDSAITTFRAIEDFTNPLICTDFKTNLRQEGIMNKQRGSQRSLFIFILIIPCPARIESHASKESGGRATYIWDFYRYWHRIRTPREWTLPFYR